jgi:hypothetical protein
VPPSCISVTCIADKSMVRANRVSSVTARKTAARRARARSSRFVVRPPRILRFELRFLLGEHRVHQKDAIAESRHRMGAVRTDDLARFLRLGPEFVDLERTRTGGIGTTLKLHIAALITVLSRCPRIKGSGNSRTTRRPLQPLARAKWRLVDPAQVRYKPGSFRRAAACGRAIVQNKRLFACLNTFRQGDHSKCA